MVSELVSALKGLQGFSALGDSELESISSFASLRTVRAGETIFCQGEPSPYCFGVVAGEIVIQHVTKDSRFPPKVLGILGPGNLFGESSIFAESPRVAMASCSKEGKLAAIRGSDLRGWISKNSHAGQALLIALLQSSLGRLNRTSHELSVIYGVERLLGSDKPFLNQMTAALEFVKLSWEGLDDILLYQRSTYWEEFSPLLSVPYIEEPSAIPLSSELVQKVSQTGTLQIFDAALIRAHLMAIKLPWEDRQSIALVPLFDWEKSRDPLQGLLCLASRRKVDAFSMDKRLLLTSLSHPLAEALSRYSRRQENLAQERLQQSKKSVNP